MRWTLLAALGPLAGLVVASPAWACGPRAATTYASRGGARIYSLPATRQRPTRTYACAGRHEPIALDNGRTTFANLPYGDLFAPSPAPTLVDGDQGSFVAYERSAQGTERVALIDLRRRRTIVSRAYRPAGDVCYHCDRLIFSPLFVTSAGLLAYGEADASACTGTPQGCRSEVVVLGAGIPGRTLVLDSGPGVDPGTVAVSANATIWWTHDSAPRAAALPAVAP
jgi:hypothetical protein